MIFVVLKFLTSHEFNKFSDTQNAFEDFEKTDVKKLKAYLDSAPKIILKNNLWT